MEYLECHDNPKKVVLMIMFYAIDVRIFIICMRICWKGLWQQSAYFKGKNIYMHFSVDDQFLFYNSK